MSRSSKSARFPRSVKDLSKEDCARILRRALSHSGQFETQVDVADAAGLNRGTVAHYFTAQHKPSQARWTKLRTLLTQEDRRASNRETLPSRRRDPAERACARVQALVFLLEDELRFFLDAPKSARQILKHRLPGKEVGYLAGLLTALYDEDHLEAFKVFSAKGSDGSGDEEAPDR
ncbi:MAG: hypothetical protein GF346_11195 [Candidatus Eisenbacteria bacterium]|nr:hypothetical protein [Candidatus Latescibacterota bacterium]MBD3303000.1 hypothetical protein [Candidatus Eisenbacteria bacterium]